MTGREFSLARHTFLTLGAAAAVLLLTTVLLGVLQPGPVLAVVIAFGGLVGCVVAMALVSRRITGGGGDRTPD